MHLIVGAAIGALLGSVFFGTIGAAGGAAVGVFAAEKLGKS